MSSKTQIVKIHLGGKEVQFPQSHVPGIRVPKGGSSCSTCRFLGADKKTCDNYYWVEWSGTNMLPEPADEYCSDWYEVAKGVLKEGKRIEDVAFEDAGL